MKILIVNGGPRPKANTSTAVKNMKESFEANIPAAKLEVLRVYDHEITACIHCLSCRSNGGVCVMPDESALLVEKANVADVIVFATPVYWWGITAQIKLFLDKLFSNGVALSKMDKKIGLFVCGEAELDNPQYSIIKTQFDCICEYMGWDFSFFITACTPGDNDFAHNEAKIKEVRESWENIL